MCQGRFNWPERHTKTRSALGFCQLDQLLQATVNGGLRRGRPALEPEFPQRQRRMSEAELRGLSQSRWKLADAALALQPAKRLQLCVSRPARANEIRLVCVREPVGASLRLPHHRSLVEHERRIARPGEREPLGDAV